jgi:iron complex outermembrane recepter protein
MQACRRIFRVKSFAASVCVAAAGMIPLIAGAQVVGGSRTMDPSAVALDEVVVTAQKRSENVQNVPETVTVLSQEVLAREQLNSIEDFTALIPGMSNLNTGGGQNQITFRGVTSGPTQLSGSVGVYLDEIPFGSSNSSNEGNSQTGDFDTFDMARIEALQGPQGTLYGANAIGGLIKYVTNAPNPARFDALVNVGGVYSDGGGTGYSFKGMVNIPITDDAAVRATAYKRRDPGFVDDNGQFPKSDVNANTYEGGRVSLLWDPTDKLSLRLTGLTHQVESDGTNAVDLDPTTLKPLFGNFEQQRAIPEHTESRTNMVSLSADWDMGWATLTSATGYSVFNYDIHADYTGYYEQDAPLYGLTSDTYAIDGFQRSRTARTVEELRLASKSGGRVDWQIGYYYDLENSYFHYHATPYELPEQSRLDAPNASTSTNPSDYRDNAVFGNIDYHFTSKVDLLLGARESYNHQYFASTQETVARGIQPTQQGTSDDQAFTFLASPRWNISSDLMAYARIAKGYRAGGPNLLPADAPADVPETFKPDSIISYEVGAKKEWADVAHLVLDVSAFSINWKDIQLYTTVDGLGAAINGSKAHIKGAQLSLTAAPLDGLTLALNVGYQDARLGADTPAIGGLNGDRLPSVPELSGALMAEYRHALFGSTIGIIGATYRYIGNNESDFFLAGDQFNIPAVSLLDLRAGLEIGRTSVSVVAKNVTNTVGYSAISYGPTGLNGYALPPTTVGLYVQQAF